MNESYPLPSLEIIKQQAKTLRAKLKSSGTIINHSKSLELLAHQHDYKDWNCLHAAIGNRKPTCPVLLGQHVKGTYLGQPFQGEVTGIQALKSKEHFRVTFSFDNAVDVITFDGMSNFRKNVFCIIGQDGKTVEKTSNGEPQLSLNLGLTQ